MRIELDEIGKQRFRLSGEVDAETLRRERLKRARAYAPYVQIKGFRPGHVPLEMVARHLGPALDEEARESAVRRALSEVLKERSLTLTFEPAIQYGDTNEDGAIPFTTEFETLPDLDPKDYLGVEVLDVDLPPVNDEDVEVLLKRLQVSAAVYRERPADSVAHEGDMTTCELVLCDEAGAVIGESRTLELEAGLADKPLVDIGREILGMKAGEERSFNRTLPVEGATDTPRNVTATVKVVSIREKVVPPLDDEFARRYGGCETLEEWRGRLRDYLEKKRQKTLKQMREDAVVSTILRANPFEVGEETVRRLAAEAESRVKERLMPGVPTERLKQVPLRLDAERMETFARDHLARKLLLDAIAKREGVEAAPEDVEQKLGEMAVELDVPLPRLRAAVGPEALERLRAQIREEKTLDMLVRYAVVKPRGAETGMKPSDQALMPETEKSGEMP